MDPRDPARAADGRRGQGRRLEHRRLLARQAHRLCRPNTSRSRTPTSTGSISPAGAMTPIGDHDARHRLWRARGRARRHAVGDQRRGFGLPAARHARSGDRRVHARCPKKWDVDGFDLARTARTIAYVVNEAGSHRLQDHGHRAAARCATVEALPAGIDRRAEIAPWGEIGFTLSSARSASDVWSVDPAASR